MLARSILGQLCSLWKLWVEESNKPSLGSYVPIRFARVYHKVLCDTLTYLGMCPLTPLEEGVRWKKLPVRFCFFFT